MRSRGGSKALRTGSIYRAAGRRPVRWHSESEHRGHRREEGELTLDFDEAWDDVPTAELGTVEFDEPTASIEPPDTIAPRREEAKAARGPEPAEAPEVSRSAFIESPAPVQPAEPTRAVDGVASDQPLPERAPACEVATGTLLCERYLLGRQLGTGGSSLIFEAEDRYRTGAQASAKPIALKVLRREMRANPHALTRLRREFRQMQRLDHPGIAKVFDLANDGDVWFMTMELIRGQTINQWLRGDPNRNHALKVIAACCEALSFAHEAGVVHGDLKPSNVLVLPGGDVKLVDFGSAAERDAQTGVVNTERSFAATPPYASPQVLSGDIAEPRDDVFSLACLTYAVLTRGRHPFERKSSTEAQVCQLRPTYAPEIPARQFAVLVRSLAWEREQRPKSVREFLDLLLAADLRSTAHTVNVETKPADAAAHRVQPATAANPAPPADAAAQAAPSRAASPGIEVDPEDVARLKAALAAAEGRTESTASRETSQASRTPPSPPPPNDPFARFKGYVAGPRALAPARSTERTAGEGQPERSAKKKWSWPWQRSTLSVLLLAAAVALTAALLSARDDAPSPAGAAIQLEPVSTAVAAAPESTPTEPAAPPASPTPVEEKKNPTSEVRTAAPPATSPGEISFTTRTLQVGAHQTMAALLIRRLSSTRGRARVAWTIEEGTARRGVHYELGDTQVVEFLDGQSVRSLFIPLTPERDRRPRQPKTFTVKLQQTAGGPELGEIKQVYVTILGDLSEPPNTEALALDASGG